MPNLLQCLHLYLARPHAIRICFYGRRAVCGETAAVLFSSRIRMFYWKWYTMDYISSPVVSYVLIVYNTSVLYYFLNVFLDHIQLVFMCLSLYILLCTCISDLDKYNCTFTFYSLLYTRIYGVSEINFRDVKWLIRWSSFWYY